MKTSKFILLLFIVILSVSFKTEYRRSFSIEINYVNLLHRPFVKYFLDQKRIKVIVSKDQSFKSRKTIYERLISKSQSDSIYLLLTSIKFDTSKTNCKDLSILDGTYTYYEIKGLGIKKAEITNYACITFIANRLKIIVENQIVKEKYTYTNLRE